MSKANRPKIAFWFRYGPAEHAELFHAMPHVVEQLAQHAEVHYFGMRSKKTIPETIRQHAVIHELPFHVNRHSNRDKQIKALFWLSAIPWMGRTCRRLGIQAVYMDETIPLTAPLALRFFGPNVAMTIADFFVDIYFRGNPLARKTGAWIRRTDFAAWRRLPLIYTRAQTTKTFLSEHGIPADVIHPVYDPCDFTVYHPMPGKARIKASFGFTPEQVVLVHHGILHPNKGNDWIIRNLARMRNTFPHLRYLLIGDGPDMPKLKTLVQDLHMEDTVKLTGWLPRLEDVNHALNAGDIGLVMRVGHESDHFHMTGALVHSLACGLPVLAARLGGIAEIVKEGANGLLFDPTLPDEFTAKLGHLYGDASLRAQMGTHALQTARESFDMQQVTEATVQPLLKLLGHP